MYIRNLYYAGKLEDARKEALKLREMDANFARAHYELGLVLEEEGRWTRLWPSFDLG